MKPTSEREITQPVDLCLSDGTLNPAAVGWSRDPLHRPNLRGWGRCKRWEYWGVVTKSHILGLTVSSLDYAGVHGVYLLDRETGADVSFDAVVPLARGVVLPKACGLGRAHGSGGRLTIDIEHGTDTVQLTATAPDVAIDLHVGAGGESMGVVIPWSARRYQYTVKDVGRAVSGTITTAGARHDVEGFAVLDHGRGKWPYAMTWNWAAGYSAQSRVGVTLGGKWTDGTGLTENALFVGGRTHKIGDELTWEYDRSDWLRPWRVRGPRVDATFEPFHERRASTNLGVIANETHQCFGAFSGRALDDHGSPVSLDGLVGWAEEARNRW